jgi:hypothetical protein
MVVVKERIPLLRMAAELLLKSQMGLVVGFVVSSAYCAT